VGKPSAPKTPSVTETAGAQTGSNISTALAQQQLNTINQVGPDGSITYDQTGTYEFKDPTTGKTYTLPKLTQTTALSQGQQAIYDAMQGAQTNLANTAQNQSARLDGLLSEPFSLNNETTEARLMELASSRLNPQLDRRREQETARLAAQGVRPGSTAYDVAMRNLNEGENDAVNQLMLTGRQQAVNELLTERQVPLNEIIGLASGTQVQMPQFGGTPQTGLAGTDVAGITQQNFANQQNQYNQNMSNWNSTVGGLFGLGSRALMAFSDKRLKKNIRSEGGDIGGVPVKSWSWRDGSGKETGVIAQDVEKKHPKLVHNHQSGYKMVDYGKLMQLGSSARSKMGA
jgi:hypothetical protein